MKCPKDSSLVVLYAVYTRVSELEERLTILSRSSIESIDLSDVIDSLTRDITRLKAFLVANNYPLPSNPHG